MTHFSRSPFTLMILLLVSVIQASGQHISQNTCLSPPLPPYFKPVNSSLQAATRSGNNYSIPFDTIAYNSTLGTRAFDIVICIDGVINNTQISLADNYIDSFVARLQTVAHYGPRIKYFNIYRIAKLSNEEGSSWGFSGDTSIDNRYGSRFNAFGLSRLLIPEKTDTLFADVQEFVTEYDLVLMLSFDRKYGGSGWSLYDGRKVASSSIDRETGWHLGDEVFIHEIQHIMPFAGHGYLGDEYEDSASCAIYDTIPDSPNFTSDTVIARKWQHCEGLPGIGYYPEAGICQGNFRPSALCAMRQVYNLPNFCPVCRENSTAYLDSVINPVYWASAAPASFIGIHNFSVQVDTPVINTFLYQWFLDDSLLATSVDSIEVDFNYIDRSSNHKLRFICTDIDPFILDTSLRRPWVTEWNLLTKDTFLTFLNNEKENGGISIFPNPAMDRLTIISTVRPSYFSVTIMSPEGKIMLHEFSKSNIIELNISTFSPGIYFIQTTTKNQKNLNKIVKQGW
ncbi:MAG: M64 family metallopeptidase [Bacteroidota bacterium]